MGDSEILIVEAEPELADVLRLGFERINHCIAVARDGDDALRTMAENAHFEPLCWMCCRRRYRRRQVSVTQPAV